jgi:uncharacterized protein (UPF0332 family)
VNEGELFLLRAERALHLVDSLVSDAHFDVAASRTYYAVFYIATALLAAQGLRFTRHGQLIAEYGRRFARNAVLDPAFHRLLRASYELRVRAGYWPDPQITADDLKDLIAPAHDFLAAARAYLATQS